MWNFSDMSPACDCLALHSSHELPTGILRNPPSPHFVSSWVLSWRLTIRINGGFPEDVSGIAMLFVFLLWYNERVHKSEFCCVPGVEITMISSFFKFYTFLALVICFFKAEGIQSQIPAVKPRELTLPLNGRSLIVSGRSLVKYDDNCSISCPSKSPTVSINF